MNAKKDDKNGGIHIRKHALGDFLFSRFEIDDRVGVVDFVFIDAARIRFGSVRCFTDEPDLSVAADERSLPTSCERFCRDRYANVGL